MSDQNKTNQSKEKAAGKGAPTPSRKAREAANKRPLVGGTSPEARKAAKAAATDARRKAREGMYNGDDRYLTARDKGPQRRLVRDIVDSRFTAGELVLPALFVVILISTVDSVVVQFYTMIGMWVLFLAIAIDAFFTGRRALRRVAAKFGADKVERGLRWYAAMRSIQMRPMRLPKPQVKRGTKI